MMSLLCTRQELIACDVVAADRLVQLLGISIARRCFLCMKRLEAISAGQPHKDPSPSMLACT